ncbi:hypothetical protein ACROYT_G041509 [Oculina patagonica]
MSVTTNQLFVKKRTLWVFIRALMVVAFGGFTNGGLQNPSPPPECTQSGPSAYNILDEANRYWSHDEGATYCDRYNIMNDKWYRFMGAAGTMMATYCIPEESCNAHMAGWISDGDHPSVAYQKVPRTACMHWSSSCCYLSYSIEITNCSGFYVYKLKEPTGCSQRYCGVNGPNDACYAIEGTNQCGCPPGYSGDPCQDTDECTSNTHTCHSSATCSNTVGSFTCACNNGYTGDGTTCSDVDECTSGTHDCHSDATCSNTPPGSFTCSCNDGYSGDGRQECVDIDECQTGVDNCDLHAQCANNIGSFDCTCDPGYSGDGIDCPDNDECSLGTHDCHSDATCINTGGSFNCSCHNGYSGDGKQECVDIDECQTGEDNCHLHAQCDNTIGSFNCICDPGYSGDGVNCPDIDECSLGTHDCHLDATCINTGGSFNCSCNNGYSGDGKQECVDIDECQVGTHNCHLNAQCDNNIGSFYCTCHQGYTGDGVTCSGTVVQNTMLYLFKTYKLKFLNNNGALMVSCNLVVFTPSLVHYDPEDQISLKGLYHAI